MGNKKSINQPAYKKGREGKILSTVGIENFEHPLFCFRFIHKDFSLDQCSKEHRISFIEKLMKLSQVNWQDLIKCHRHGLGFEKMPMNKLKARLPASISAEFEELLAFRYHGKRPFLGYRNRFIFHVIFIEREFGELYDHG